MALVLFEQQDRLAGSDVWARLPGEQQTANYGT